MHNLIVGKPIAMSKLLVIDDDSAVLVVFRRAFRDSELTVVTAQTAEDGLRAVVAEKPDVIILDIQLPDMSGLELYGRIHRTDATIPVIFITASGSSDTAIQAMKLGAFEYIPKPL